jgi:hypothetical protein
VGSVRELDRHGRAAELAVVRSLNGPFAKGRTLSVVWEELSAARAPRFAPGERVLVSLEALPGQSIWRERIPDAEERSAALHVAQRGDAFLRDPSSSEVDTLAHYLWLDAAQRDGAKGAEYLVALAVDAQVPLAMDAVAALADHPHLADEIDARSGGALVAALVRDDGSEAFRAAIVALIGARRLEATRAALEARADAEAPAPAAVFEALAQLDGGIGVVRSAALLASEPAAQRRVAARYLSGPDAAATLDRLLRRDDADAVRAASAERLFELEGDAALEPLLGALADPATSVRGTAARLLAGFGAPAVAPLRQVVAGNDPDAASAAVIALGFNTAPTARAALREIASDHPETRVRKLAELTLGGPLGHED